MPGRLYIPPLVYIKGKNFKIIGMLFYLDTALTRHNTLAKQVCYRHSEACDVFSKLISKLCLQSDIKIAIKVGLPHMCTLNAAV